MKITLCGSTRFRETFHNINRLLTLSGHTVYSVGYFVHGTDWRQPTPEEKLLLDAVHMNKISNSDGIAVLNKNNYIGESTHREILFAMACNKNIHWLEYPRDLPFGSNFRPNNYPLEYLIQDRYIPDFRLELASKHSDRV